MYMLSHANVAALSLLTIHHPLRPHLSVQPISRRALVFACDAASGGGDNGGSIGKGGGGDDDDREEDRDPIQAAFAKAGLDPDAAVPDALLDAMSAGRIGDQELANWKQVQSSPLLRLIAASSYVLARLLADPRLPSVLAVEILVGSASLVLAEKAARGDKFLKELDFVLANQVLIILTNIALVLALSPAAQLAAAPPAGTFGAYMAGLPSYFLQSGDFSAAQRATCFFAKAVQFSVVGSCTASAGQFV